MKAKIIIEAQAEIIEKIVKFLKQKYSVQEIFFKVEYDLTKRELEILKLVCESKNNSEIAKFLKISSNTVKAHIKKIFDKLNVKNRLQLAVKSIQDNVCFKIDF